MYGPAPPRPKKTNIVRSRSGCKCCRERRTKCDEKKPVCGTCARLGVICEPVRPKLEFRIVTGSASRSTSEIQEDNTKLPLETGIYDHDRPTIPFYSDSTLFRSLQRSERDIFYTTYWEDQCLPALHPMFRSATTHITDFPAFKYAVLALSSCNLSRMAAEQKTLAIVDYTGAYSPNVIHQTRSQLYYSSAIHEFIKLSQQEFQSNIAVVLTLLVLFAHIESTRGNFEGFCCHVQGLTTFLDNQISRTSQDLFSKGILIAWMQIQFQVWWARAYFSSIDVQIQQPRIVIHFLLQENINSLYERRIIILDIMCESHRLNFTTTLKYWQHQGRAHELDQDESHGDYECEIAQCSKLLYEKSKMLDDWLQHLPQLEQPIGIDYLYNNPGSTTFANPLIFESHDAALNYAYYVISRIMQCMGFFNFLRTGDDQHLGHECNEAESWVQLLLRVAAGIDMKKCVRQNSYTIGFSGLMLAALLRSQDLASGIWIENWLATLKDMHPTEEGSFPIYQALSVAQAINQQKMVGKDVFAVSLPVDDGGGAPKFSSYNSQLIDKLLIHGRCRETGDLFTKCISINR